MTENPMFKHLLISTDGSSLGNKAAKAGIELAQALGAKVTAYYAIEQLQIYDEGYMMDQQMIDRLEESARAAGQKRVDAIGKMAKAAGVPFVSVMMTQASTAYEGIIDAAKKRKCDVIFMASHGRRGLSRLMMGSLTQKVLAYSRIPVVVYR